MAVRPWQHECDHGKVTPDHSKHLIYRAGAAGCAPCVTSWGGPVASESVNHRRRSVPSREHSGREPGRAMSAAEATGQAQGGALNDWLRERISHALSEFTAATALIVLFIALSFASPYFLTAD